MSSSSNTGSSARTTESISTTTLPSWNEIRHDVGRTEVGSVLNKEVELRKQGRGSAHVHNTLRLFDYINDNDETPSSSPPVIPKLILYRDHAGWCPYCQKTMLLVEEKKIPIRIELINMRSYGDKPAAFLRKVPNGLLPALETIPDGQVITESQVVMQLLDEMFGEKEGYKPMLPAPENSVGWNRYNDLAELERELFRYWCSLVFRPEGPPARSNDAGAGAGLGRNPLVRLLGVGKGIDDDEDGSTDRSYPHCSMKLSSAMRGFLDCLARVDQQLQTTPGPWFFESDGPTMIDFVFVSHVERMLASCAFWKGVDMRDTRQWSFIGLTAWLEAFEKREVYLAFKSDYYTHVMDIPPQYGPGYDGGFDLERNRMQRAIVGSDGKDWKLPLPFDDPLQPLYKGPPLPICVLQSLGLEPDADGSYEKCDQKRMEMACRTMAAWKLSSNGDKVATFASRGGPSGSKNPRKSFGAQLADPYADPDRSILPAVDAALRIVCQALQPDSDLNALRSNLKNAVPENQVEGSMSSLAYLRDRIGVPRDLPLASARYMRAYLNWGIDVLQSS